MAKRREEEKPQPGRGRKIAEPERDMREEEEADDGEEFEEFVLARMEVMEDEPQRQQQLQELSLEMDQMPVRELAGEMRKMEEKKEKKKKKKAADELYMNIETAFQVLGDLLLVCLPKDQRVMDSLEDYLEDMEKVALKDRPEQTTVTDGGIVTEMVEISSGIEVELGEGEGEGAVTASRRSARVYDVLDNIRYFFGTLILESLIFGGLFLLFYVLLVLLILPALFFMLLTRTTHVELETTAFNERQDIIAVETVRKKFWRLFQLSLEALVLTAFSIGLPFVITLVIVPKFGPGLASAVAVGVFCLAIILLQLLGTIRAGVSVMMRQRRDKLRTEPKESPPPPKPSKSFWKDPLKILRARWFASLVVFFSLALEFFQVSLYPFLQDDAAQVASMLVNSSQPVVNAVNVVQTAKNIVYLHVALYEAVFWLAVGLVLLLLGVFCGQFMKEVYYYAWLKRLAGGSPQRLQVAREYFFYSFVGAVVYSHGEPRQMGRRLTSVVGLLSDGLFLFVVASLLGVLGCEPSSVPGMYVLVQNSGMVCWEGQHEVWAIVTLVCLAYYVPTSILLSPMFMGAPTNEVDVRYNKLYVMAVNLLKVALVVAAVLLPQTSLTANLSSVVASVLLLLLTVSWVATGGLSLNTPCESPPVNIARVTIFASSTLSAGMSVAIVLQEVQNQGLLFLILLPCLGFLVLLGGLAYLVWRFFLKGRNPKRE